MGILLASFLSPGLTRCDCMHITYTILGSESLLLFRAIFQHLAFLFTIKTLSMHTYIFQFLPQLSDGKSTRVGKFSIEGTYIRIDGYPFSFVSNAWSRGGRTVSILLRLRGVHACILYGFSGKPRKSGSDDAPNSTFRRDQNLVSTGQNKQLHSEY